MRSGCSSSLPASSRRASRPARSGRTGGVPVPKGYTGVEASLPTTYKTPAKKGGSCTIGFQNPIAGNETLHTLQLAVVAQAKVFGCKVIALDDRTTPDKQVSNMQQLIAQKVNAIIFYPLDPKATVPVLKQAKSKGIPVVAIDGTFGSRTASRAVPARTSRRRSGRDATSRPSCRSGRWPPRSPARQGRPDRHRVPGAGAQVPEPAGGILGEEGRV